MHLSGPLSDWSISDLLHIMEVTKKTGSLDIDAERRGRIHFKDGEVTGAELTDSAESLQDGDRAGVADVIYVLSSLTEGTFAVGAADGPDGQSWSVEDILAEVEALRGLESDVVDAGLLESGALSLASSIEDPLTISPEDWPALVSLVKPFDLSDLEDRWGRAGAIRILHALHRLGIAELVEPDEVSGEDETGVARTSDDDESGWLDRLADDIVPESDDPTWVEDPETDDDPTGDTDDQSEQVEPVEPAAADVTPARTPADLRGVSAPASTTLTDGVYDEIRRLRSKVAES